GTLSPTPCPPLFLEKNDASYLAVVWRGHQHVAWHLSDTEQALEALDYGQRRETYRDTAVRGAFRGADFDLSQGRDTVGHRWQLLLLNINEQATLIEDNLRILRQRLWRLRWGGVAWRRRRWQATPART